MACPQTLQLDVPGDFVQIAPSAYKQVGDAAGPLGGMQGDRSRQPAGTAVKSSVAVEPREPPCIVQRDDQLVDRSDLHERSEIKRTRCVKPVLVLAHESAVQPDKAHCAG